MHQAERRRARLDPREHLVHLCRADLSAEDATSSPSWAAHAEQGPDASDILPAGWAVAPGVPSRWPCGPLVCIGPISQPSLVVPSPSHLTSAAQQDKCRQVPGRVLPGGLSSAGGGGSSSQFSRSLSEGPHLEVVVRSRLHQSPAGARIPMPSRVPCCRTLPPDPRSGGLTASLGPSFCGNPTTGRDRTTSSVPRTVDTWWLSCLHDLRATSVLEASSHGEALVVLSGDGA